MQIRVHLAYAGFPIAGDEIYGVKGPWIGRQALHAASLSVHNPRTDLDVTVEGTLNPLITYTDSL